MDSSQPSQFPCTPPPAGGSGGPHQNRADLGDMCAELTEISDNAGSLTIDCGANAPAGEPHFLFPLLQTFNVPADDLCLYHCAEAMKDLPAWMVGRKLDGYATDASRVHDEEQRAKAIREEIIQLAEKRGWAQTAVRLRQPGVGGHPGLDEVELIAEYLGGQTIVEYLGEQYLKGVGALVAYMRYDKTTDGYGAVVGDHFFPVQSWLPREAETSADVGATTASVLSRRLSIHGASTSDFFFESLYAAFEIESMELRKMNADVIERHETIVSATERKKKMLLRDYPAWPQEFRRLALGALAMYKTRLTDIYTREYVQLLHVVLGGDFLHAHDKSMAYFWNDEIGFVDRFDGLLPEIIYGELKQYLLRLEGLFRSFVGEVRRDDDALLTAI